MKMSKKIAWTATFFTLLVLGYSTAKPGQQEEFIPIQEYNDRIAEYIKSLQKEK